MKTRTYSVMHARFIYLCRALLPLRTFEGGCILSLSLTVFAVSTVTGVEEK